MAVVSVGAGPVTLPPALSEQVPEEMQRQSSKSDEVTAAATGSSSTAPLPRHFGKYSVEARTMTPEVLQELCTKRGLWSKPQLNTQLFLNHKGFDAIANLGPYTNVRLLHLDNNNIARIEGLQEMVDLRSLHLGSNRLTKIEGLESNVELRHLELQCNGISEATGLSHLEKLEHLNLANNTCEQLEALEGLVGMPALVHMDLSANALEASEGVVEFWQRALPKLKVLRYHGNPGARHISNYRKLLVNALPDLSYLDERPVFPLERKTSAAWAEGGQEAMQQAKKDFHKARVAECGVDPDRREFLTRMRNMAIERIRREEEEERQRKEAELAAPEAKAVAPGAPDKVTEDEAAHDSKAPKATDAKEDSTTEVQAADSSDAKATATPAADSSDSRFEFKPPARGATAAAATTADESSTSRRPSLIKRFPEAAEFRIVSGDHRHEDDEEQRDRLVDRQIDAMGDDPWAGTAKAAKPGEFKSLPAPEAMETTASKAPAPAAPVPLIWEGREEMAAKEEERIMELNMANASLMNAEVATAKNELTELD
mmetsp:Transcript_52006/g.123821  ORF Transcript_52006/g.123821 Transcript_52006/m.123821 type:complete len:543 (+) Transcript_52006:84-1712(+)